MANVIQTLLEVPEGYRSAPVARTLWQMDDQSRRLVEATADATPEELGWQPAPGMNTIGMLLAHIAVAEAHMTAIGLERLASSDVPGLLGLTTDDDGLPLPEGGRPPAALGGRTIEYFHGLLEKARANTRRVAVTLSDSDLAHRVTRPRPDGNQRIFNLDWMLYHLLEHEAGHFGQILLLRHLYRASRAKG